MPVLEGLLTLLNDGDGSATAICPSTVRGAVTRGRLTDDVGLFATRVAATARHASADASVWVSGRDPYLVLVSVLGALHGHSVALVEAEGPPDGYRALALACPPALVVGDRTDAGVMRWARANGHRMLQAEWTAHARSSFPRTSPRDDVVLQFFTSGTTGTPKCVGIGRDQLISAVQGVARRLSLTPADTSLSTAPLTHTLGMITTILVPLVSGGTVAFADPKQPREFLAALARSRPTWCAASPAGHQLVYRLMSGAGAEWPGLRFLRASAAPLAADVARQLEDHYSAPVISAYVMTEAPGEIASQAPDRDRRAGTVGKPTLCDVEIRSEGRLLPAGRSGEIWIRGPNVVPAGRAWVPTKDVGWLDDDGFLRVTGRVDDIINSGGLKIWPPDVEIAARADPVVATAVAFPVPHPGMGETVGLGLATRSLAVGHAAPPIGGRRSPSPTAASITWAARSRVASSSGLPSSWAPIGRPSPDRPHGTLRPGRPARLHDSVKTSARYMSTGLALAPNGNATVGVVGVRITSQ